MKKELIRQRQIQRIRNSFKIPGETKPGTTKFIGENLSKADFSGLNLSKCDFTSSNLSGVNFQGSNLYKVSLKGCNLEGANFHESDLNFCDLSYSNIKFADFCLAYIYKANFFGCENWGEAYMSTAMGEYSLIGDPMYGAIERSMIAYDSTKDPMHETFQKILGEVAEKIKSDVPLVGLQ